MRGVVATWLIAVLAILFVWAYIDASIDWMVKHPVEAASKPEPSRYLPVASVNSHQFDYNPQQTVNLREIQP